MKRGLQGEDNWDGDSGGENGTDSAIVFQFLFSKLFPNIPFTFHQNPMQQVLSPVYRRGTREFMVSERMCRHQRNNWAKEPQVLTHSLVYFVWHDTQVTLARLEGGIRIWAATSWPTDHTSVSKRHKEPEKY